MTTYSAPTSGQRDAESPIDTILIGQMIDNPVAMFEKAAGAPVLANSYITQAMMGASSVGQSQLKTGTGSISKTGTGNSIYTLAGGQYGFYPQVRTSAGTTNDWDAAIVTSYDSGGVRTHAVSSSFTTYMTLSVGGAGATYIYAQQRYVTASRPYNLGDGEIGQFIFALVDDATGLITDIYAAPEAPWHNNGPTDIRAEFYDAQGRGWRWEDIKETVWDTGDTTDYITPAKMAGWVCAEYWEPGLPRYVNGGQESFADSWKELCIEQDIPFTPTTGDVQRTVIVDRRQIEITQVIKQADMPLIPHPFIANDLTGKTVVLLDPVSDLTWHLAEMSEQGISPNELLHEDYLRIDNVALNRSGPSGVMVVPYKWRNTA